MNRTKYPSDLHDYANLAVLSELRDMISNTLKFDALTQDQRISILASCIDRLCAVAILHETARLTPTPKVPVLQRLDAFVCQRWGGTWPFTKWFDLVVALRTWRDCACGHCWRCLLQRF